MKNIYLITILTLFIFNCGENVREDITERYNDGHKKVLVKYKGEGESEKLIEKIIYNQKGEKVFYQNFENNKRLTLYHDSYMFLYG